MQLQGCIRSQAQQLHAAAGWILRKLLLMTQPAVMMRMQQLQAVARLLLAAAVVSLAWGLGLAGCGRPLLLLPARMLSQLLSLCLSLVRQATAATAAVAVTAVCQGTARRGEGIYMPSSSSSSSSSSSGGGSGSRVALDKVVW
jgi:uncharacterized membrane protein YgcG